MKDNNKVCWDSNAKKYDKIMNKDNLKFNELDILKSETYKSSFPIEFVIFINKK